MPRISAERTSARKEEIINACERLYRTMSFKEITMKEIGSETSFTRTSIYNYFHTKEEIFLALMQREYELWVQDLEQLLKEFPALTATQLAEALARTLEKREQLLKLLAMNHYDIEASSREENLAEFKVAYGAALGAVERCLAQYFPALSPEERQNVLYSFFPVLFGIYPYAIITPKQRTAMQKAGIPYRARSIYEISRNCLLHLLISCERGETVL